MSVDRSKTTTGGYNHDVIVSDEFLKRHSSLEGVLRFAALEESFAEYDRTARSAKTRWVVTSILALTLGVLAIIGVLAEIALSAFGEHLSVRVVVAIEVTAIASLLLFLSSRLFRLRVTYLNNCFARERLRQFRFQVFLNGAFTEKLAANDPQAVANLNGELSDLKELFRDLTGCRQVFDKNTSSTDRLFFKPTVYSDPSIATAVFEALKIIRVNHQLSYTERRLDEDPDDRTVALKEHLHWTEAVSKWCLLIALLVPAFQLGLIGVVGDLQHGAAGTAHLSLSTFAVAMACLSAGVRAYQAGTGASGEIDSYETYVSHLEGIREQFLHSKKDPKEMVLALRDLEMEAERELRRFLKIKRKASFLFA